MLGKFNSMAACVTFVIKFYILDSVLKFYCNANDYEPQW